MFRPRLIPFPNRHHVSKNRRRTHNEHAYFVSVSGMCHRDGESLAPSARVVRMSNQKREIIWISTQWLEAGESKARADLPANERKMPKCADKHQKLDGVIKSTTIFILLSA